MVYIDHQYKIIVLENPKSGSTSLIKSLEKSLRVTIRRNIHRHKNIHMTAKEAMHEFAEYWDTYLKITTLRNPLERFISSALMPGHIARYDPDHLQHETSLNADAIVKYYIKNKDSYVFCRSQDEYTTGMDVLIRIDHFQEDYDALCDRVGMPRTIVAHFNKNNKKTGFNHIDFASIYERIYF